MKENMIRKINFKDTIIWYDLQLKNVKNINLRIKPNGSVCVSANKRVSPKVIDEFIQSKAEFIIKALKKFEICTEQPKKQYYAETEIQDVILMLCKKVYPYFEKRGIKYPRIKFRKMVSRWGSCHSARGILTFNINLMYAPQECIEYVVLHEFTHFLQANHSDRFYDELSKVCPRWKELRKRLKEINIR